MPQSATNIKKHAAKNNEKMGLLQRKHDVRMWTCTQGHQAHVAVSTSCTTQLIGLPFGVQWKSEELRETVKTLSLMIRTNELSTDVKIQVN